MISKINKGLLTSNKSDWATPIHFYNQLDKIFNFTLDPCATKKNAKCERYFSKRQNGLKQSWRGETVFMNPPYGREIKHWCKKALEESKAYNTTVVGLLPARTDTLWFQNYILNHDSNITEVAYDLGNLCFKHTRQNSVADIVVLFVKGRLKFGNSKNSAPFPSAVVLWR